MVGTNTDMNKEEIKQLFQPYNPNPSELKAAAVASKSLLKELHNLDLDRRALKPRENRLFHQFTYFLRQSFDNIYENYFDGIYMLGPDYFCEQTICFVNSHFTAALKRVEPKSLEDLELLINWIKQHNATFTEYLNNVKEGVQRGMVQPIEVCKAAARTFQKTYGKVGRKGPEGAMDMSFAQHLVTRDMYKNLSPDVNQKWKNKYDKDYVDMVKTAVIDYFGKPLHKLITFLKNDHVDYCVPSKISSGLAKLPLMSVYKNGEEIKK